MRLEVRAHRARDSISRRANDTHLEREFFFVQAQHSRVFFSDLGAQVVEQRDVVLLLLRAFARPHLVPAKKGGGGGCAVGWTWVR